MAKILYGVAGEGMGHAVRSRVVIEHLKKNHKVKVVSAHNSYRYLKKYSDCEEIDYFKIIYRNNKVSNFLTALNNLLRLPTIVIFGLKVGRIIKKFKPDIIITDFEPITDYYAFFKKIPVISIDNQHIITEADHRPIIKNYNFAALTTKIIIKSFIIKKDKCFITSFLDANSSSKDFFLIKPLLRDEIIKMKPKKKDHILVYQTSKSNKNLVPTLKHFKDQEFIFYGFHKNRKERNVIFKERKEKEFLEDLRTCKAVITNGGFTLISEAIFLKKPILTIPFQDHFEQILNGIHVHMSGFGNMEKEISEFAIENFLNKLEEFESYLKKYKKHDNKKAFKMIEKEIDSLIKNKKKKR